MSETDMTPTAAAGESAATEGALNVHAVESSNALKWWQENKLAQAAQVMYKSYQ